MLDVVETFDVDEVTVVVFGLIGVWFDVLDDVGVCVVEEAADVFGCDVVVVVVIVCCVDVELNVEEGLIMESFDLVSSICNERRLLLSSIGVVPCSVWFDN